MVDKKNLKGQIKSSLETGSHPGCLVLNCSQAEQVFIVSGIFSRGGAVTVQCPESQTRGFSAQSYLKSQDF